MEKLGENRSTGQVIVMLGAGEYNSLLFLHDAMTGKTGSGREWGAFFELLDTLRPIARAIYIAAHNWREAKDE